MRKGNLIHLLCSFVIVSIFIPGRLYAPNSAGTQNIAKALVCNKMVVALHKANRAVSRKDKQELKIQLATPCGEVGKVTQIIVAFNQPMVALTSLKQQEKAIPMVVEPKIVGEFHWLGTSVLSYRPKKPLLRCTNYKVTIKKGIKSIITGKELRDDYIFSFKTPRVKVVSTEPGQESNEASPDKIIVVEFNQPVNIKDVNKNLTLVSKEKELKLSFKSWHPRKGKDKKHLWNTFQRILRYLISLIWNPQKGEDKGGKHWLKPERVVLIKPVRPLKKNTSYKLIINKNLHGREGPLPMKDDYILSFSTYPLLRIVGYDQEPCSRQICVEFSNPVKYEEFLKRVKITPKVKLKDYSEDSEYYSEHFCHPATLKPSVTYKVEIDKGLKDKFNQRLKKTYTFKYTPADYDPILKLKANIGVVESRGPLQFPLIYRNFEWARLQMCLLKESEVVSFAQDKNIKPGKIDFQIDRKLTLSKLRNERMSIPIDLKEVLGRDKRTGIVYLRVSRKNIASCYETQSDHVDNALIQVTDIGLTAKMSWDNSLVWVTRLSNGAVIPGAKITIRNINNQVIWQGKTNKDGLAIVPGRSKLSPNEEKKIFIFAEKGKDMACLSSSWTEGISPWDFNIEEGYYEGKEEIRGFIFTERDVYRPGETVHFKGIIRKDNAGIYQTPAKEKITVTVTDREDKEIDKKELILSRYGTFSSNVSLPKGAKLGNYEVLALLKGEEYPVSGSFRVEEYRVPEFEVNIESKKNEYIFEDIYEADIHARYLFGAAMKKGEVEWTIRRSSAYFSPPNHESYIFSNNVWWLDDEETFDNTTNSLIKRDEGRLDKGGRLHVRLPLKADGPSGSQYWTLEATVTDVNRQVISNRVTNLIHQGEFYIGLKPSATFLATSEDIDVDVLSVTPEGNDVSGKEVKVTLLKREWHTVRKKGLYGDYCYESEPLDKEIKAFTIVTSKKPKSCHFKPKKSGLYLIKASSVDKRGNEIITSFIVYVTGYDYVSWEREEHDRIELVADKELYQLGDVAKVLIKSPYRQAKALITVERERIIESQVIDLKSTAQIIEVPISNKQIPNLFVSVVLVQGRTSKILNEKGKDVGKPSFKVGLVNLPVSSKPHQLKVKVSADKEEYRPGDEVEVKAVTKTQEKRNIQTELAIMVVDEGVLSLTGFETPDPLDTFFFERPLSVLTAESIVHLIERQSYGKKGKSPGGDGSEEESAETVRSLFATCAYWNPSVETNLKGEAKVKFKLPDNLTKYRIMVIAVDKNTHFGAGETYIRVNKPLMILPSLPRFVISKDEFEAGAVIHNYGKRKGRIKIKVRPKLLSLIGGDSKVINLAPGEAKEVRFSFKSKKVGLAKLTFKAWMGKEEDIVEAEIPIQLPRPLETVATYGETYDEAEEKIIVPQAVREDTGGLTISVSSTALSSLKEGVKYLVEYPYGCLEQTVSRIIPLIFLRDIVKEFKITQIKAKEIEEIVKENIEKIGLFQRENGGFGFWQSSSCDSPDLSAYTFFTLTEAKNKGYEIEKDLYNSLKTYLTELLHRKIKPECTTRYTMPLSTKAFIVFVLANAGFPEPSYHEGLFEKREELCLADKAFLAMAIHKAKGEKGQIKELLRDLDNHAVLTAAEAHFEESYEGYNLEPAMFSDDRTTAIILLSLISAEPKNPLIPKIVRWLLKVRINGRWRTTHESAYALMALSRYYEKFEKDVPNFKAKVKLGKGDILKVFFKGRTTKVDSSYIPQSELQKEGDSKLLFQKKGKGLLYYEAKLQYSPLRLKLPAVDEGFILLTDYRLFGEDKKRNKFRAGDIVKVHLTIITPITRNYVVIEDPIPAGLEIVNQTFKTSSRDIQIESEKEDWQKGGYFKWWYFNHIDIHDDRVVLFADYLPTGVYEYSYLCRATTSGRFFDPAARAEEMYTPETFGRTEDSEFMVE